MRYVAMVVLCAGCLHTQRTQSPAQSKEDTSEQRQGKRVAAPRPVGTTPESIVKNDGMKRIQKELGVSQSGELDEKTRNALEKFQRKHELAATGLPDLETVEKLGLDTNDVFQSGSKKKENDRGARKQAKSQAKEERVKQ
jgi:hypothetical protein